MGKWHLDSKTCAQAGFDYFQHWLYGDEHWKTQVRDVVKGEDFHEVEGYNSTGMTNQALEFISDHAHDENPFFLMLSINPPHWRWDDAPEEFVRMYPDGVPQRPNVKGERWKHDKDKLHYHHYHAHISAIDRDIGRLMDDLEKQGIAEDTVFIYTSDHGSSFWSQGVGSKGNPYDEAVRIPFMVRWPGKIAANTVRTENIGTPDMLPTLCGLAGIARPEESPGHDFSPTLLGGEGPEPAGQLIMVNNFQRNYFKREIEGGEIEWFQPFRGVRTRTHTFVVSQDGDWLLYDNENDPYQMKNLVNDPAHREKKEELRKVLLKLLAEAEDPFLPEELKGKNLPERIALQARRFSILPYKKQWDAYKADAVKPYLAKAPDKKAALEAAADKVFDEEFFGRYKALHNGVHGKKGTGKRRWTSLEPAEVQKMLDVHEKKYAEMLKKEIDKTG